MEQYKKTIKDNVKSLIDSGDLAEASELINQYQSIVPDDVEFHSMKAIVAILEDRLSDAKKILQRALSIDKDNFDLLYNLAYVFETQEKKQEAYDIYLKLSRSSNLGENNNLVVEALQRLQIFTNEEHEAKITKGKIVFFVKQGMDSFLDDIIEGLSAEYEAKKVIITNLSQIDKEMRWADVCWFEWCDDLIVYGSKLKIATEKRLICRLHRYEAFSDYINNVKWVNVDKVIFVAEHIRDVVMKKINLPMEKCEVIYNGIDIEKFPFLNRNRGYNLAWIGYLNLRKNPMLIIQYFYELVKEDKRYQLYIAGSFQEEIVLHYIQEIINKLDLQDNVHFDGFIPNEKMSNWLGNMHYIVSGSIAEGHPVGVMEAMCSGLKPIIHFFPGIEKFYPKKYIYYNLNEFKQAILEKKYDSKEYRLFIERNYSLNRQINAIKEVVGVSPNEHPQNIAVNEQDKPLVTIGITSYNAEKYLDECFKSVLEQSYKNIEILVVDDKSTDRSLEKLKKYSQKYNNIRIMEHKQNSGSPDLGRQEVIEFAKGAYFMLFDSDDFFADQSAVEKLVKMAMRNDKIDYVYCDLQIVNGQSERINIWKYDQYDRVKVVHETFRRGGSGILTMKGLFKTSFFRNNNIAYQSNGTAGDTLTSLLCMKLGMKIKYLAEDLIAYRQHQNNFTFDMKKRIFSIVNILEYIVKNFEENLFFPEHEWDKMNKDNRQANKYYLVVGAYYRLFQQFYSGQWKPWENDTQKQDEAEVKEYLMPLRNLILSYSQKVSDITDSYNKDLNVIRADLSSIYNTFSTPPLINLTTSACNNNSSLKFLLRRVENAIEIEESLKQIFELLVNQIVEVPVLIDRAKHCVVNPDQVLNDIGVHLFGKNYMENALDLLNNAYSINPKNQDVLLNIGIIAYEVGDTKTAMLYFKKLEEPSDYATGIMHEIEARG